MTKAVVDEMIQNMKRAGIVAKATSWVVEGINDQQKSVRYVGLFIKDDWLEIFSENDNMLLKFVIDRNSSFVECYLANKPPFIKIMTRTFVKDDKWESVLGEVKRRLKKDKNDFLGHTDGVGNIYVRIKPFLKP